jgi:hypothetical protein
MIGGLIGELLITYLQLGGRGAHPLGCRAPVLHAATHITLVVWKRAIRHAMVRTKLPRKSGFLKYLLCRAYRLFLTVASIAKDLPTAGNPNVLSPFRDRSVVPVSQRNRMKQSARSHGRPSRTAQTRDGSSGQSAPADAASAIGPGDNSRVDLKPHRKSDDQLKFLQMNCREARSSPCRIRCRVKKIELTKRRSKASRSSLKEDLLDFRRRRQSDGIRPGPAIKVYESARRRTKINQITNLEDDLALG